MRGAMTRTIWLDFMGAEIRLIQGPKYRTRIAEAGRDHSETLIMTHPGGGHLETFAPNVVPLGKQLHVVGLEMLWHGFSDTPEIGDERTDQEGQQVLDVLDALAVDKAWVHGTASGGVVPTWLALNNPERLKGIIYQATTGGVKVQTGLPDIPPTAGGLPLREHMFRLLENPTREVVRERLLHTVQPGHADLITDELIDARLALYLRPETNEAMTRYYNNGTTFSVSEEQISKVNLPVLVIASDASAQSLAGSKRLASLFPRSQLVVLKGTGLWGHWESPAEFNDAVSNFILGAKSG